MFNIGEIVYLPVFGAGYIISIEDKEVHGEIEKYYIIHFILNEIDTMLPISSKEAGKLRRAINPEDYVKIIEIFSENPKKLPGKWIDRYKYYRDNIYNGNIYKLCGVLRDISGLSRNKKLSKSELNMFRDILFMVSSELALVLNREFEETKIDILNLIKTDNLFC